jgi:cation diffusion facilitator family transporter
MSNHSHHTHNSSSYEKKTRIVVIITFITMVFEIFYGYYTNSMALLADGYHMSSHVFALGLTWIAYVIARKYAKTATSSFRKEKLLALSGFTSAIVLQVVAISMAIESISRLLNPLTIQFKEAIIVAVLGLLVNIVSAFALHHDHDETDHNIKAAYLHVLADALTSVAAIIALTIGLFYQIQWLDAVSGIISAIIITKWAFKLIVSSSKELIDFQQV